MNIIFLGKSKESSCKALKHLLKKNQKVVYAVIPSGESDLRNLCEKEKINIISDLELYEKIKKNVKELENIDLVISFLFWKKIKQPLISLGKKGCINFHPAPLPEYRGVGGYNFAILDNLNYWGVSSHYVDVEIDTGKIIQVDKFEIDEKITAIELEKLSQIKLLDNFKLTMEKFITGFEIKGIEQGEGKYIDKKMLEKSKEVFLDDDEEIIDKKIRAFWFPPYNGAFIKIGNKKYTLTNEELLKKISKKEI